MSLLEAALDYLAQGFSVIPIRSDDRKRPALDSWKPYQERRATEEEAKRWFTGNSNGIAVVCGRVSGGLTVIDIDDPGLAARFLSANPGLLESTICARTGGGNLHVYLRVPFPPAKFSLRRLDPPQPVDIQGEGSYVVIPPSIHASGRHYEWMPGCGDDVCEIISFDVWFQGALGRTGITWTPDRPRGNRQRLVSLASGTVEMVVGLLRDLAGEVGAPKGNEIWFSCPFHNDWIASLSANTERPVWHCFGCGEGGGLSRLRELQRER